MKITLNNQAFKLNENSTCSDLIKELVLTNTRLAIEVNGSIIAQSNHKKTVLNTGDKVEIVRAVGGG